MNPERLCVEYYIAHYIKRIKSQKAVMSRRRDIRSVRSMKYDLINFGDSGFLFFLTVNVNA